jgi:hypothetical protein
LTALGAIRPDQRPTAVQTGFFFGVMSRHSLAMAPAAAFVR